MSTASRLNRLLLTLGVMAAGILPGGAACPVLAQTAETGPQLHTAQPNESQVNRTGSTGDVLEDVPEDELAPAAVQLDLAKASPLIQELYAATRETKEQAILARLAKATDLQGRTALHWAVFGSSYNTKPRNLVAYEEIADAMIAHGIDINREDGSRHRTRLSDVLAEF